MLHRDPLNVQPICVPKCLRVLAHSSLPIQLIVHYATREERATYLLSVKQITRGENGHPPEKYTILFFRPIIVNIIIVKKLWLGKKIVQW